MFGCKEQHVSSLKQLKDQADCSLLQTALVVM
jgi:hypothetical protein